jgi:hypothetical protein
MLLAVHSTTEPENHCPNPLHSKVKVKLPRYRPELA